MRATAPAYFILPSAIILGVYFGRVAQYERFPIIICSRLLSSRYFHDWLLSHDRPILCFSFRLEHQITHTHTYTHKVTGKVIVHGSHFNLYGFRYDVRG